MDPLLNRLSQTFPDVDWNQNILSQMSSLAIVSLMVELEGFYQIEIHPMEMNKENFASYNLMKIFLEKKINGPY